MGKAHLPTAGGGLVDHPASRLLFYQPVRHRTVWSTSWSTMNRICRGWLWILMAALAVALVLMMPRQTFAQTGCSFSPERAGFAVKFKEETFSYRALGIFVLPGETVVLETLQQDQPADSVVEVPKGAAVPVSANRWKWKAPEKPGLYPVTVTCPAVQDTITLNAFVMVPFLHMKGGSLNGYRIGNYPSLPLHGLSIYKKPQGFIEVTPDNEKTLISPHFTLKQFLCKQEGDYPKYVVLQERLLIKLEIILQKVNEVGYPCRTFTILSGYRTPAYNGKHGNGRYSRHLWGGAADIFIDENPQDDVMDDLNKDGVIDCHDADLLSTLIENLFGAPWHLPFWGGLAQYETTNNHGPFVHVDVRGFPVRW